MWHSGLGMENSASEVTGLRLKTGKLVLGIDTCGSSGSVALGRIAEGNVEILGQIALAGRSYSGTVVTAVADLLAKASAELRSLCAIVAVRGPGSFTGVRVGLSAVKGLAEPAQIPVVAVSRLAVLASRAGCASSSLDAHRHELFLRVVRSGLGPMELLAGAGELSATHQPEKIAVCDEAAAVLLATAWPGVKQLRVEPPNASDAIRQASPRVLAGEFVDLALLDGHYLRRSDAEIFGEPVTPGRK